MKTVTEMRNADGVTVVTFNAYIANAAVVNTLSKEFAVLLAEAGKHAALVIDFEGAGIQMKEGFIPLLTLRTGWIGARKPICLCNFPVGERVAGAPDMDVLFQIFPDQDSALEYCHRAIAAPAAV